jgi:hypothetical protein
MGAAFTGRRSVKFDNGKICQKSPNLIKIVKNIHDFTGRPEYVSVLPAT